MDFPGDEELRRFFHCSKTEMSCMGNPQTFIRQLRDYDLIPEKFYKKVDRTKSKEALKKALYDILDWLERERPRSIKMFWRCVFKETIINQYPTLQQLSKSLKDGSFYLDTQLFNSKPQAETDVRKRKEPSEDENIEWRQEIPVSKKKCKNNMCGEKEQPSQSSLSPNKSLFNNKGQVETDVGERKAPSEDDIVQRREEIPVPKKKKQKNNNVCGEKEQPSQSSLSSKKSQFNTKGQEETDVGKRKKTSEDENVASRQEIPVPKTKNTQKNNNKCKEEKEPSQSSSTPKKTKIRFSSPVKGAKNEIWMWPIYKSNLPVTCGNLKGTLNRDGLRKGEPCIFFNKQWVTPPEFEKLGGKGCNKNWKISTRCMNTPIAKLLKAGHLKSANFKQKNAKKLLFSTDNGTISDSNHEFESKEASEVQPKEMPTSSHTTNTDAWVLNVTCGALAGKLYKKRFASGICGKSIRTNTCWMTPADFVKEAFNDNDASWKKDILWEGQPLGVVIHEEQKNDDECYVCKCDGDLVVCDQCPRSFHPKCHLPHIDNSILSDNRTWMCTFCIFTTTQGWRYSDQLESDIVLSKQISKHMLGCQYLLLYLFSADDEQLFATNPCVHLNDYTAVVETPMWLRKIAEKIQKNDYCYVAEFVYDVQLIFSNCDLYNKDNPYFLTEGSRLKRLFDEEFKKAF
ncbi:nuclear body protein SP140-like protein isoform X1 [Phycodurus eques]|uniref:nuclear body protein SP140-like protein isoform X1 n=1 Tax=Phycodurus eques TaxID=693459 RepID=UPI002ACE1F60|nr:nuclear body protein SP140-like protein isoform X1 [Phycodurus eques]